MGAPLYFYTENFAPTLGSGAHNRLYLNIRAYLDLGFEVECVKLRTTSTHQEASPGLQIKQCAKRDIAPAMSHNIESDYVSAQIRVACDIENRRPYGHEKRKLRYARRAEQLIAKRSSLILCIADHEAARMRTEWGCPQAEFFPMSIADEEPHRKRTWLSGGCLNLLHLGSPAHFPTYRSLEFLLEKVSLFWIRRYWGGFASM